MIQTFQVRTISLNSINTRIYNLSPGPMFQWLLLRNGKKSSKCLF